MNYLNNKANSVELYFICPQPIHIDFPFHLQTLGFSNLMASSPSSTSSPVQMGLAVLLEPSRLYSLERHYLPLGKCGGHPAWLNPANLPSTSELACQVRFQSINWSKVFLIFFCITPIHEIDFKISIFLITNLFFLRIAPRRWPSCSRCTVRRNQPILSTALFTFLCVGKANAPK